MRSGTFWSRYRTPSGSGKYIGFGLRIETEAERTTIVGIFDIIQQVRDTGIHLKVNEEPKSSRGQQKRSERQMSEECTCCCCCCFSHSAYWLPNRKNYFTRWPTPLARGLLDRGKKSGSAPALPPRCLFGRNKIKITRRIYMPRRYAGLGPSCVRTRIPSTRRLGQWVSLRKILRLRVR